MKKIISTRQSLVDAARKLFGQIGMKNTTMNDIAVASKKGRRTLYTYFKNKNEILDAVVAEELNYVVSSLEQTMVLDLEPLEKFNAYIITRMNAVRTAVQRNGSLQAEFFRDVIRVELARRKFEKIEVNHLKIILQDGIDKGVFEIQKLQQTAIFIHFILQGLDVPYIRGAFDDIVKDDNKELKERIYRMIKGLLKTKSTQSCI